jgi:hypothetical protein
MFSPDGRHIAFVRHDGNYVHGAICVCSADGRDVRELVVRRESEWMRSPVWLSDSKILYGRDADYGHSVGNEVWQVDLDGKNRQLVFRPRESSPYPFAWITDVSPDRRQLAMIAGGGYWSDFNVYTCNLKGFILQPVWRDDNHADGRALWSADGKRIAWRHTFSPGANLKQEFFGVGLARLTDNGQWKSQLQGEQDKHVTPLTWSPHGHELLCADVEPGKVATLFTMGDRFQRVRTVAELRRVTDLDWLSVHDWYDRMAGWAVLPADLTPEQKSAAGSSPQVSQGDAPDGTMPGPGEYRPDAMPGRTASR